MHSDRLSAGRTRRRDAADDAHMTTLNHPARVTRATLRSSLACVLLPCALLLGACASGGSPGSVDEMRSSSSRATNAVPDGVTEMRETMADQRAETNQRLDSVMGGAPAGAPWYGPMFDVFDVAASFGGLLY